MGAGIVTGTAAKHPTFNLVISNVPGPRTELYLAGAHLDEAYPVSIPTHYMALNITITGYGDSLGFGYIACRRSVPALQRMLDYTQNAITALEIALGLEASETAPAAPPQRARATRARKAPAEVSAPATSSTASPARPRSRRKPQPT